MIAIETVIKVVSTGHQDPLGQLKKYTKTGRKKKKEKKLNKTEKDLSFFINK